VTSPDEASTISKSTREEALHTVLREHYGDDEPPVTPTRLGGGASRTTWFVPGTRRHPDLYLQCERQGGVPGQSGQRAEIAAIGAARGAGVPAPIVVASSEDPAAPAALGRFMLLEALPGRSTPKDILRDPAFASARDAFATDVGGALARLHSADVDALAEVPRRDPLLFYRDLLDRLGEPHPALELGLTWLVENRRERSSGPRLVHGDFRLGNLMFTGSGLSGVLDWELTHLGDPAEDIGWLCLRSWRFGGGHPVAGIASIESFLAAYHDAGGDPEVDLDRVHWWEVLGTFKWAVICVMQAAAHMTGQERSVELALIGRRTAAVERDLLQLIGVSLPGTATPLPPGAGAPGGAPHDAPRAPDLLVAVREFLEGLAHRIDGQDAYMTRVCVRALEIAGREMEAARPLEDRHHDRLRAIGCADDAELAQAIRSGRLHSDQIVAVVAAAVVDKVLVSDPRRLADG